MSLAYDLTNGKVSSIAGTANMVIKTGNGNSNFQVTAKNASIETGCGEQNISANITNNFYAKTGCCGKDVVKASVGGNAKIATGGDDDVICLDVDGNFDINAGSECGSNDNDIVLVSGNLENTNGQNRISTGNGSDNVRVIGNNVEFNKGNGNLVLGFFGNNYNVNSNADNNIIGFWGDNVNMNINGNGYNDIQTLDYLLPEGKFTDFGFEELLENDTYIGTDSEIIDVQEELTGKTNVDEIAKKYNLSNEQAKLLKTATLTYASSNGKAPCVLYYDKKSGEYKVGIRGQNNQVADAATGKTLTYKNVSQTSKITKKTKKKWYGKKKTKYYQKTTTTVNENKFKKDETVNLEREKKITTTYKNTNHYSIDGVNNVSINMSGNSNYNVNLTSTQGNINVNTSKNNGNGNVNIRSGYNIDKVKIEQDVTYENEKMSLDVGRMKKTSFTYTDKKYLGSKTSWSGLAKGIMKGIVGVASAASAFIPVVGAFVAPAVATIGNTLIDYETQTVLPGQKKSFKGVYKDAAQFATSALSYVPVVGNVLETAADMAIEYGVKDK